VFEVDHPATQAVKRAHLDKLPRAIADVTFVPVDFERESLDAALARAGHDETRPTCWIWEGVVMYLTPEAMRSTLANIASRSAEGSTLIVNYHAETRRGPMGLLLSVLAEPVKSQWSREEMAGDLRAAGFDVIDDSGIEDWAKRFAMGTVDTRVGRVMRIVVARRRGNEAEDPAVRR
jgi:methyltransferase (TIGR00027 family)